MSMNSGSAAVAKAAAGLASICLALLALLGGANAGMRVFNLSIEGSYEIAGFLSASAMALGLGYCQLKRGHIIVDFLTDHFPVRLKRGLDVAGNFASALLFGMITWRTAAYGISLIDQGELSETLKIPYYPMVFLVAAGLGLLCATLLADGLRGVVKRGAVE